MALLSVEDVNERLRLADAPPPPPPKPARSELSIADVNARLQGAMPLDTPATAPGGELTVEDVNARLSAAQPMNRITSALHAAGQGAVDVLADIPQSIAIIRQAGGRKFLEQLDAIDRGGLPKLAGLGPAGMTRLVDYMHATPERRVEIRAGLEGLGTPPQETALFKAGVAVQEAVREALPTNPEFAGEFFADMLPRGVGSTAGFILGGAAGRLVKLPALVGAAGLGASTQGAEQFKDALASGASLEDAYRSAKLGAIVGTSEGLPVVRMLDRFDRGTGGSIRRLLMEGVKGGIEEGAQETFQHIGDALIASDIVAYDPDRQMFQGIGDAAGVGFTVGALFSVVAAMLGARMRGTGAPQATPAPEAAETQAQAPETAPTAPQPSPVVPEDTAVVPPAPPRPPSEAVTEVRIGFDEPPLAPGPKPQGDVTKGRLGTSVPRSPAELNRALDRFIREGQFGQGVTPEIRQRANRLRQETDEALAGMAAQARGFNEAEAETAATEAADAYTAERETVGEVERTAFTEGFTDSALGRRNKLRNVNAETRRKALFSGRLNAYEDAYDIGRKFADDSKPTGGPETVTLRLRTATGHEPTFNLPNNAAAIEDFRKRLVGKPRKFFASTAGGERPGTLSVEDVNARLTAARTEPDTLSVEDVNQRIRDASEGSRYVTFMPDRVEGTTPEQPIRREDVLRPLLTALGVPLYQGRIKGRTTLGFYRRGIEEVRIKRMNDLEVTAHEIAHMLDDRIPEIRKQWLPATNANKTIRDELRGVSYDRTKIYEGFAEFVRLWATQPREAQSAAPHFFGWFEDFLARSEYGPVLRKAQADMTAWYEQDALSRARSKIGVTEEINAGLTSPWDRLRQLVADDLHGIMAMERSLTGELAPVGAYETARLTRGKYALIEGALLYGAPKVKPDGSHTFVGKGLEQILDPISERLDDWLMYAVGRSARELKAQGREKLFTPAEVKSMVELETPEFRRAFDSYQIWNRAILDFAQAKGVINPVARSMWQRTQYLPFHRVGQPGAFSPVPGDWTGIKALTGGTDNLRDVLGNMIGNAAMLIDAALVNEARLEVAKLSRLAGGARFMVRIPTEERTARVHSAEIERAILEALGVKRKAELPVEQQVFIDQIIANMGGLVPLTMRGQTPFGGNVVAVLRDGKPEYYEVADPVLYRALVAFKRPARSNPLMRGLMFLRRLGQASITLSLDFLGANLARDTLMGGIMSRHGFKPFVDSARGMASRVTVDENYRDFIANGGGFSSYLVDEDAFRVHLERFYRSKGIDYNTVLDSPRKLLLAMERIADAVEMSTRLGEFRKAIKREEHPRHAAYSGREVSTDFGMRGDSQALGFFFDTVVFLKATVNGLDRYYRGLAHDPNRAAIARRTAMLALVSMGLYAINRDNPLYDDVEDWDRDLHWHFYIPKPETIQAWADGRELPPLEERYEHFKYPKIWEIGSIASIAERTLEGFLDSQPAEAAESYG